MAKALQRAWRCGVTSGVLVGCLGFAGMASAADPCVPLVDRIASQIVAKGIRDHVLTVVPISAEASGRVVGWCDERRRKVVLQRGVTGEAVSRSRTPVAAAHRPTSLPEPQRSEAPSRVKVQLPSKPAPMRPMSRWPVITECRNGLVIWQGDCPG